MSEHLCYVITSDLHTLPLVIAEASDEDDLYYQLEMWAEGPTGEMRLSEESRVIVNSMLASMKAPNDGLLGTAVSEQFTLPELGGMRIHLQAG